MSKSNSTSFSSRFIGAAVKPGQKVFASLRPEIIASSTKDKFVVNDKAAELLGLKTNDKLYFIDLANLNNGLPVDEQVEYPLGNRFFIAVNYRSAETNEIVGGGMGKNKVVSYSKVWGAMHVGDPTVTSARPEDLIRMGKAVARPEGRKGCIATQKVAFGVERFVDEEGNTLHVIEEGGEPVALYALVEPTVIPHDPAIGEE